MNRRATIVFGDSIPDPDLAREWPVSACEFGFRISVNVTPDADVFEIFPIGNWWPLRAHHEAYQEGKKFLKMLRFITKSTALPRPMPDSNTLQLRKRVTNQRRELRRLNRVLKSLRGIYQEAARSSLEATCVELGKERDRARAEVSRLRAQMETLREAAKYAMTYTVSGIASVILEKALAATEPK